MYKYIKNPVNNKQVNIHSKLGKKIIKSYLNMIKYGGSHQAVDVEAFLYHPDGMNMFKSLLRKVLDELQNRGLLITSDKVNFILLTDTMIKFNHGESNKGLPQFNIPLLNPIKLQEYSYLKISENLKFVINIILDFKEYENYEYRDIVGAGSFGIQLKFADSKGNIKIIKANYVNNIFQENIYERLEDKDLINNRCNNLRQYLLESKRIKINFKEYLVSECMQGDLEELVKTGKILPEHKLNLICQLLFGMYCIHNIGIVHGDIKTSNILYNITDEVIRIKFADFDESGLWITHGTEREWEDIDFYNPPRAVTPGRHHHFSLLNENKSRYTEHDDLIALVFVITEIFCNKKLYTSNYDINAKLKAGINIEQTEIDQIINARNQDLYECFKDNEQLYNILFNMLTNPYYTIESALKDDICNQFQEELIPEFHKKLCVIPKKPPIISSGLPHVDSDSGTTSEIMSISVLDSNASYLTEYEEEEEEEED